MTSAYSLKTEGFRADPYPTLHRLREEAPVHWHDEGYWTIARYDDIARELKNTDAFSNTGSGYSSGSHVKGTYGPEMFKRRLSTRDEPSHSALRRVMAKTFTPRALNALKPSIDGIVDRLVAEMRAKQADGAKLDFVQDFAFPLTVMSINLILGVPDSVREKYKTYVTQADDSMGEYFKEVVAHKERQPGDDMTSDLIRTARAGHEFLPPEDVHYYLGALWTAGNWTTTLLISNAAALYQSMPGVRDALRADPALVPAFVEEVLRFDAPVIYTVKNLHKDYELHGKTMRAGDHVFFLYGAANHDSSVFREPSSFDIQRSPNPHFAFADGPHFCLGAPLARMEAVAAFTRLVREDISFDPAAGTRYAEGTLTGYRTLPASLS